MDGHLRGLIVGLFLGIGIGFLLMLQAEQGWGITAGGIALLAVLAWAEHAYFHRKPEAA